MAPIHPYTQVKHRRVGTRPGRRAGAHVCVCAVVVRACTIDRAPMMSSLLTGFPSRRRGGALATTPFGLSLRVVVVVYAYALIAVVEFDRSAAAQVCQLRLLSAPPAPRCTQTCRCVFHLRTCTDMPVPDILHGRRVADSARGGPVDEGRGLPSSGRQPGKPQLPRDPE